MGFLSPYALAIKLALTAALVVFVGWLWMSRGWAIDVAAAASLRADRAESAKKLTDATGKLALGLNMRTLDRERDLAAELAAGAKEIRNVRPKSIPDVCWPVLRGNDVALERMYARRAGAGGGGSAAPVVPRNPGAAAAPRPQ